MQYLLLMLTVVMLAIQPVLTKQYNIKSKNNNTFLFNGISAFFAMLFFVVSSGFKFSFNIQIFPYALWFAFFYLTSTILGFLAIKIGPFAITNLIGSYSLIIPTLFGIIFLKESIGVTGYIGICLILISLFMISAKDKELRFTAKWVVIVIINFFCGGMTSLMANLFQKDFNGQFKNEFMIISLFIVMVVLIAISVKTEKGKLDIKNCIIYAAPRGIANAIVNLEVLVLAGMIPSSILFPSISAGGVIITFILAIALYRERFNKRQLIGYLFGIISIILLNI